MKTLIAALAALALFPALAQASPRVNVVSRTGHVPQAMTAHTNALSVQEYINRSVGLADQYLCGHNTPGWGCWSINQAWVVNWQAHGPHVAVSYTEATASGGRRGCVSNIYWSHTSYFNYGNTCYAPF
jgi:hypothetical protein